MLWPIKMQTMKKLLIALILLQHLAIGNSQDKDNEKYMGNPMIANSSSISGLIIPVLYKPHGIMIGDDILFDHFADIIFYNNKTGSVKRLFNKDMYIKPFHFDYNPINSYHNTVYSSKWIFYFVKADYNNDEKIDKNDPYTIYVSDKKGEGLKSITQLNENALSIDIYDKQGFALIKLQRDIDGNKKFSYNEWADFYYVRLDLNTLTLQDKINWP